MAKYITIIYTNAQRDDCAQMRAFAQSARAREGAARSRKIFARFHFLHISVACARDARSRAGIARERARSRGARARCASARRKILRDRPSDLKYLKNISVVSPDKRWR